MSAAHLREEKRPLTDARTDHAATPFPPFVVGAGALPLLVAGAETEPLLVALGAAALPFVVCAVAGAVTTGVAG